MGNTWDEYGERPSAEETGRSKESALDFWLIKRYARHKVIRRCIASYSTIETGRGEGRDGRESHYEATCCGDERLGSGL